MKTRKEKERIPKTSMFTEAKIYFKQVKEKYKVEEIEVKSTVMDTHSGQFLVKLSGAEAMRVGIKKGSKFVVALNPNEKTFEDAKKSKLIIFPVDKELAKKYEAIERNPEYVKSFFEKEKTNMTDEENDNSNQILNEKMKGILLVLRDNGPMSPKKISQQLGISHVTAKKYLGKLEKNDIVWSATIKDTKGLSEEYKDPGERGPQKIYFLSGEVIEGNIQ